MDGFEGGRGVVESTPSLRRRGLLNGVKKCMVPLSRQKIQRREEAPECRAERHRHL